MLLQILLVHGNFVVLTVKCFIFSIKDAKSFGFKLSLDLFLQGFLRRHLLNLLVCSRLLPKKQIRQTLFVYFPYETTAACAFGFLRKYNIWLVQKSKLAYQLLKRKLFKPVLAGLTWTPSLAKMVFNCLIARFLTKKCLKNPQPTHYLNQDERLSKSQLIFFFLFFFLFLAGISFVVNVKGIT